MPTKLMILVSTWIFWLLSLLQSAVSFGRASARSELSLSITRLHQVPAWPRQNSHTNSPTFHRKGKLKASIAALVERQGDKWPGPDEFTSKTTVNRMKEVLLDPRYGFTKAGGTSVLPNTGDSESSLSPAPEFTSSYNYKDSDAGDKPAAEEDDKQQEARPAKLGYRDVNDPAYRVYFIKIIDWTSMDETRMDPDFVVIPATNRLEIFIEPAEDLFPTQLASSSGTFDVADPNAKPLEHARQRRASESDIKTDADAEWLRIQLRDRPGYQDFKDNQRKVQMNPGVAASWMFIANFSSEFFGEPSHIPRRKKIQKKSIQDALKIRSTSLAEAENAARILKIYGENGTHPAQAVINCVALEEKPAGGAQKLYPFLVQWENAHKLK
ncbi:hypothetical protein B0H10DRAFT_1970099 [Mycena sp. CBHHK59/15]|nr:hypothetical protein B0H10DRAFT_1970099 [Mycena sp. CBHHK59/15]